jgi:hypothetical protein
VVHVDAENKIVDLSDSVEEMIYSDVWLSLTVILSLFLEVSASVFSDYYTFFLGGYSLFFLRGVRFFLILFFELFFLVLRLPFSIRFWY